MRAVVFDAFGSDLRVCEVPAPAPPPGGAVIRVEATGLCRSDWHGWQGHDPDIRVLPHVPGHELAGVVEDVGPGVGSWRAGDRVTVPFVCACGSCTACAAGDQQVCERQTQPGFTHWGSFAEYVAIENADVNLVALPEEMTFPTAASLGCRFATAFRAVVTVGRVRPGEWVAVHGCGGVGLSAVMIAAAAGARVVAVDVSPQALDLARLAAAGGMLLFVVFVFGYYAAYDLYLPNQWVPVCAALLVAVPAVVGATGLPRASYGLRVPIAVAAAVALVAAVPLWQGATPRWEPPGDGLRVAAYNIRMGYGESGRLSLERQADTLRALRPHVVVLSEADRGWLLNGGHDDVRLIAERLGMRYIWAPAADEVWGDALLTDLPVTSVRNHVLVQGGPTGAQALEVGLRWQGRDVTVIGTHLQPPPGWRELDQVEQLGRIVRDAAAGGRPVVVAGDLNLEPADPAWEVLMGSGLTDPIAPVRPFSTIPTPGGPAQQIDHVLVTPGFTGRDQANVDVPHSDHRPIAVTLVPQS